MLFESNKYSCFMTFHSFFMPENPNMLSCTKPKSSCRAMGQAMTNSLGFGCHVSCAWVRTALIPSRMAERNTWKVPGYCQEGVFLEQTCSWWVVHKTPKHTLTNALFENERQVLKTHHNIGTRHFSEGWADLVPLSQPGIHCHPSVRAPPQAW